MPAFFAIHRLLISTVSPIHLGTGDDTDPGGYYLDDGVVHFFELARLAGRGGGAPPWLSALADQALQLAPAADAKPLLHRIRQQIAEHREQLRPLTARLALAAPGFAKLYREQLAAPAPQQFNQLQIGRIALTAAGDSYIPGSALKGAIRTAIVSAMNGGAPAHGAERDAAGWEAEVLGGRFQTDPFRLISISDAGDERHLGLDVLVASNRKRRPPAPDQKEAQGPPQYLECIPAFAFRAFAATLRWQTSANPAPRAGFPGSAKALAQSCNQFAMPKFEEECGRFDRRPGAALDGSWLAAARGLLAEAKPRLDNGAAFLLRIGRHSGALSVTADGVRRIKILRDPQPRSEPTTTWFVQGDAAGAGGLRPMGWVLVEIVARDGEPPAWPEFLDLARATHTDRTKKLNGAWGRARGRPAAAGAVGRQ